jgi:molybdopterin-guanine dinucleotide biosynthesis protein A
MGEISGIVLAGGQSTRLQRDKTLLRLDDEWLLESIVNLLAALSDDVLVVTNSRDKFTDLQARPVLDSRPGMGPLGGIYSGLQAMRCERGLFLACDMPFLRPDFLQYLVQLSAGFDVVIPRIGCNTEPLQATYNRACIEPIAAVLDHGERRVVSFFPRVRVRYVDEAEIDVFDPQRVSFLNINTPEDLHRAEQLLRRDQAACH